MLVGFGAVAYFQQKGVTIAAERIMPELSLSQMQIGWIQWAFMLAYTPSQLLAGRVGQRFGARITLAVAGAVAVLATLALPLVPAVLTGAALFGGLFVSQLLLGFAQAPIFPVGAGIVRAWLPPGRWGLANGVQSLGLQLGAAATPPVIVLLMRSFGWQRALFWSAMPALLLVAVWAYFGRNSPRDYAGLAAARQSAAPPRLDAPALAEEGPAVRAFGLWMGQDVTLLAASYMSMNYVYYLLSNWSFLYLVQQRHFTVVQGGWLAMLPPLGAAAGAGIGGALADLTARRLGLRWGYRVVPLLALPVVALLLLCAVFTPSASLAVAAMSLAYGVVELNEGAYWAAITHVGGAQTMSAAGLLNTGGSLGGLIGIPVVAYLSGNGAWNGAFLVGVACALLSALAWLGVDVSRRRAS